jgi:hypothetical protein
MINETTDQHDNGSMRSTPIDETENQTPHDVPPSIPIGKTDDPSKTSALIIKRENDVPKKKTDEMKNPPLDA